MSIAAPRRVGIAGLLGLLAGAIVLMPAPGNPGALRLAGVGLLWWYAALVAPLAAVLLVIVVRRASPEAGTGAGGSAALAAWTSPVVLALVAARVFSGAPEEPRPLAPVRERPGVRGVGHGRRRRSRRLSMGRLEGRRVAARAHVRSAQSVGDRGPDARRADDARVHGGSSRDGAEPRYLPRLRARPVPRVAASRRRIAVAPGGRSSGDRRRCAFDVRGRKAGPRNGRLGCRVGRPARAERTFDGRACAGRRAHAGRWRRRPRRTRAGADNPGCLHRVRARAGVRARGPLPRRLRGLLGARALHRRARARGRLRRPGCCRSRTGGQRPGGAERRRAAPPPLGNCAGAAWRPRPSVG